MDFVELLDLMLQEMQSGSAGGVASENEIGYVYETEEERRRRMGFLPQIGAISGAVRAALNSMSPISAAAAVGGSPASPGIASGGGSSGGGYTWYNPRWDPPGVTPSPGSLF